MALSVRATRVDGGPLPGSMPTAAGDAGALALSATMMRFDADFAFINVCPTPTRVTFCRDIDVDSPGKVWTNYSNLPTQCIAVVRFEPNPGRAP